jgi:hypothetical protein
LLREAVIRGTPCKNCGALLNGRYCANCGQEADVRVAGMPELISDLLSDVWNFDSRLWRSMVPLLVRPGRLTVDYLEGRRQRYVPPLRLYVILSLTFFVLASLLGSGPWVAVDLGDERFAEQNDADMNVIQPFAIDPANVDRDSGTCTDLTINLPGPLDTPERRQRLLDACSQVIADSGNSLDRALRDNVPVMMFLFIPLVALVMKLVYPLTGRKYVEHVLFFLHFHAFFFLLVTITVLLGALGEVVSSVRSLTPVLVAVGYVYLPVYLFMAMRRVYRQGNLATSCKFALLLGGYGTALALSFLITLAYTAYNL